MKELLTIIYGGGEEAVQAAQQIAGLSDIVPENEVSQWIPVSEQLPEEGQDVVVFTHEGTHVAALDEDGIWCPSHGDGWMFPDVSHWMPLPEPPEVE